MMSSPQNKYKKNCLPSTTTLLNFSKNKKQKFTLRGFKKCKSCGQMNANRAKICQNKKCTLHVIGVENAINRISIDPIKLISHIDTKIYSVRAREREDSQRNFVEVTDVTLSYDNDSCIVNTKAICYVETCKYDPSDMEISCKHVSTSRTETVKVAEELAVLHEVLFNMQINLEQKIKLWSCYDEHINKVPPVQRISELMFVVKCDKSSIFPAGRLHINIQNVPNLKKEQMYSCACKKLKIILSNDQSVVVQNDVCEHVIFLIAAILSTPKMREEFDSFLKCLESFWMKNDDDIFIFDVDADLFGNEALPEFSDSILNTVLKLPDSSLAHTNCTNFLDATMNSRNETLFNNNDDNPISKFDYNCESVLQNEEHDDLLNIEANLNYIDKTQVELSDCNIELLEEFKLTDQIDLCRNDIIFSDNELFPGQNGISLPDLTDSIIEDCSFNKYFQPAPTILVQNKTEASKTVTTKPIKMQSSKPLLYKEKLFRPNKIQTSSDASSEELQNPQYDQWHDYLIERINMSVDFNAEEPIVFHNFHIHQDFFWQFSNNFSIGQKRRLPNNSVLLKNGKYKGLVKYTWIFHTRAVVERIFTNKNISIQIERQFKLSDEDNCEYVPFCSSSIKSGENTLNGKHKKILPKMVSAYILLESNKAEQKHGFRIEWIPDVFPKSHFGILNIEFPLGFRK